MLTLRPAAALAVALSGTVVGLAGGTASAGAAPADLQLNLTAECVADGLAYWRVTNETDVDLPFTYDGPGTDDGAGTAVAPPTGGEERTYFTTTWIEGEANTTTIDWDNPAGGNDSTTKAHSNQPCVYHVELGKEWSGGVAPDLEGATLLTATSSLGSATCTSDDGGLDCVYSTGDDLTVPFGETYSVVESMPDGWDVIAGVGDGFTGIEGFDANALPDALVYAAADDRFCQPIDGRLEKYCAHTVANQLAEPRDTTTTTTSPEDPVTIEIAATATCVGDFPHVQYEIDGDGLTGATAQLRFLFGGVPIQDLGAQPLSGTVLYPGASVDPRDWPGWREIPDPDGERWETDPSDAGWRTGVVLEATVNPTASVEVDYPDGPCRDPRNIGGDGVEPTQSTESTQPPTPTVPPGSGLPATGSSETGTMALIALGLVGCGAALVAMTRRRTTA